ncbi:MAG: helix-hairpin-helix domain-containing protein [Ectothiorhodospiraceae bacterium AqS1]|nr:helix-hairpin-helix domain-containing protein [Ectothiorhodospiraceae bacterium AqS1]
MITELGRSAWKGLACVLLLALTTTMAQAQDATVDINTASADELAQIIIGVGIKKAQAIVEWREQNGSFSSIDELVQVKGIGIKTVDKNRDRLRASPSSADDANTEASSGTSN